MERDPRRPAAAPAQPRRRAPAGSKKIVELKDGRVRRRLQVYLSPEVAEELEAHHRGGSEMSALIEKALREYFPKLRA